MKIGIVYYSRTGSTRYVAKLLEEKIKNKKVDVDLIEIEHVNKPGFFKAGKTSVKQLELPIKNTNFDMKEYDFIVTGTPIWAGRPAPFVKTFMNKAENINSKNASIFLTGSSKIDERSNAKEIISKDLEKVGLKTIEPTLLLKTKKEKILDGEKGIDNFVKSILNVSSK